MVRWDCGQMQGSYLLDVKLDGAATFTKTNGMPMEPEQIGNELLNIALNANEPSDAVWA